jgi:predicted PP-loop superfamily ATPase
VKRMSGRDIYEEARALARELSGRGEPEAAKRIIVAIEGGSTSSEILLELRWEFDRLLERGATVDAELYAWTADLREAVQTALGS